MQPADWLGWGASAVLLATLLRQVWKEWHERSTTGLSSWLFVGQITASLGFVIYSWLVDNRVFVVTNTAILLTAIAGQLIYRRNVRLAEAEGAGRASATSAGAAEPPG
jgi:MtN3 and saliva related transmembrane protein